MKDSMHRAYRVADELMKDRLRENAPNVLHDMESLEEADIIVTVGEYDHIQQVLELAGTKFTLIQPERLAGAQLRPDQVLFVNCAGRFGPTELRRIRSFVEEGGFLFTTDWALQRVIESAFPGFLQYNGKATRDEVVRVQILDREDPFLASLIGDNDDPQWWLEGASYPIRVLNPEKVKVIISSDELGEGYGEPAVFVTFEVGQGRVYHMISHFYLQRTETRTRRQSSSSTDYLREKGISPTAFAKYDAMGAKELSLGEVESAFASRGVVSRVMYEKQQQQKRLRKDGKDPQRGGNAK